MKRIFPSNLSFALLFSIIILFIIVTLATKPAALAASSAPLPDHYGLGAAFVTDAEDTGLANCRYGTTPVFDEKEKQSQMISQLGAGWFLDFSEQWPYAQPANGAEFVHSIITRQKKTADGRYLPGYDVWPGVDDDFKSLILKNPGDLWIIGNEIERGPDPGQTHGGQGDIHPEVYAQAYHEIRAFIKRHDPTARTAIASLVQVTPGRLQYLDRVWEAYGVRYGQPMPVDVFNMHVYVLPELKADGTSPNNTASIALGTDIALGKRSSGGDWRTCDDPDVYCVAEHDDIDVFGEQVIAMRQWMKKHGQQQKPLILSEYSILYSHYNTADGCQIEDEYGNCFTPDRVETFMTGSFDYLNNLRSENLGYALDGNRLVQQWLWFSLHAPRVGSASNLLESDMKTLTQVGKKFRETIYAEPTAVNLVTERIPTITAAVDQSGKASVPLTVTFRNNGNVASQGNFAVTFYKDEARQQKIGSVVIENGVRGCTTAVQSATVRWSNLSPGVHRYWVTVDSEDVIKEGAPQQQDNHASGVVLVNSKSSFLPMIR